MMKLVVLSCVLATVAASSSIIAPLAYTSPYAYTAPFAYTSLLAPFNYRGPLSLAPGQPANVLGTDGRPLDTLDVNLDRSAHFTAKAIANSGVHLLKKRSAPVIAPLALSRIAVAPSTLLAHAPLTYSTPVVSTHISTIPYAYANPALVHW